MMRDEPKMNCTGCGPETHEMCLACYQDLADWQEERIAELEARPPDVEFYVAPSCVAVTAERDALRVKIVKLEAKIAELENNLDHSYDTIDHCNQEIAELEANIEHIKDVQYDNEVLEADLGQ